MRSVLAVVGSIWLIVSWPGDPAAESGRAGSRTPAAGAARDCSKRTAEVVETHDAGVREGFLAADDGMCLYYRVVGSGLQAIVVPVGFYLEPFLDRLASPERTLVFYDPRGRGRSDAVDPSRVSLDHQVRDVEAVRRHLGFERMDGPGSGWRWRSMPCGIRDG